jgi:hypothetical protein
MANTRPFKLPTQQGPTLTVVSFGFTTVAVLLPAGTRTAGMSLQW